MELRSRLLEVIKTLDDSAIVSLWNDYCYNTKNYDGEILDAYGFEEYCKNENITTLLNRMFFGSDDMGGDNSSANPNRNYFCFNGYANIISFDYIYNEYSNEFYHIDIDSLLDYLEESQECCGISELEEVFEEFEGVQE